MIKSKANQIRSTYEWMGKTMMGWFWNWQIPSQDNRRKILCWEFRIIHKNPTVLSWDWLNQSIVKNKIK